MYSANLREEKNQLRGLYLIDEYKKNAAILFVDYNSHWLQSKTANKNNTDRSTLTTDGVHLNVTGNIFVAQKMMDVLKQSFFK